jgi:hypothetical protein
MNHSADAFRYRLESGDNGELALGMNLTAQNPLHELAIDEFQPLIARQFQIGRSGNMRCHKRLQQL